MVVHVDLIPKKTDLDEYMLCSEVIDCDNEIIQKKAHELSKNTPDKIEKAETMYIFVRDEIAHSSDINSDEVTYRASDVLEKGHGLCFAKSHLLAALLRCVDIPVGFCYQKLSLDSGHIIHGLNGVYLNNQWIRLDARGNKEGINAQFSLNTEKLAYIPQEDKGDMDYPYIYSQPHPKILKALQTHQNLEDVINHVLGYF
jgi:transglutaminase-like putative cysteine protease